MPGGRAFSIAEVVVATFIVAVGLIAAARINPASTRGAILGRDHLIALRIARNALEEMRSRPFAVTTPVPPPPPNTAEINRLGASVQGLRNEVNGVDQFIAFENAQVNALLQAGNAANESNGAKGGIDPGTTALVLALQESIRESQNLEVFLQSIITAQTQQLARLQLPPPPPVSQVATHFTLPSGVAPQLVEGRPSGSEFAVTRVDLNIPAGKNYGTATVTVQWRPVAGSKSAQEVQTLTLTGGIGREP